PVAARDTATIHVASPHVARMARVRLREYVTIPVILTATIWSHAAKTRHPIAMLLRAAARLPVRLHVFTHRSAALRLGTAVAVAMAAMDATAVAMAVVEAAMAAM
ncbi:hypothetical protein FBU31_006060, partial [Coemansia sp. 'formosensis']